MGIAIMHRRMRAGGLPEYTYTGVAQLIDDGGGNWRIKLLSSGTLTMKRKTNVDMFLVGGGAGGSANYCNFVQWDESSTGQTYTGGMGIAGAGGGGGKVLTKKAIALPANTACAVSIGAGGAGGTSKSVGSAGGTSSISVSGATHSAAGGSPGAWIKGSHTYYYEHIDGDLYTHTDTDSTIGCNGGSGGSGGGGDANGTVVVGDVRVAAPIGGENGSNSKNNKGAAQDYTETPHYYGEGSGSTTREFGEDSGALYGGGGGAGAGVSTTNPNGGKSVRSPGGAGGGGDGGLRVGRDYNSTATAAGLAGTANTGGGGGGAGRPIWSVNYMYDLYPANGGNGGSGIIIIRNAR